MQSIDTKLRDVFGIESFRSHQGAIVRSILEGHDTLVVMPTGGGKSLCYQLPALVSEGTALIVSPLIALMKDQVDKLARLGISVVALNSSLDFDDVTRSLEAVAAGEVKLLYVSPERLESPKFREFIAQIPLSFIAIDEAHCISEWGHDFRTSYRRIPEFYDIFEGHRPPVIALTATATPIVRKDIATLLQLREPNEFVAGFARPNIRYGVRREYDKKILITDIAYSVNGSIVVYTSSRSRTDEVALHLKQLGFKAESYHAGMANAERLGVQERFQSSTTRIIVATSAFGMGIDKADVRAVVHYDIPATLEAYYQESGRAGRDGTEALAILLYNNGDEKIHEYMLKRNFPTRAELLATYNFLTEIAMTSLGFEYEGSITVGEQEIRRSIPNLSASVARILEVLEEANLLTIEQSQQLASAKVEMLLTRERIEELIFKTRDKEQTKMLRHLQTLRGPSNGVIPIEEAMLLSELATDRSKLRKTFRILEAKGAIRYAAMPSRTSSTSYTIKLSKDSDWQIDTMLEHLDARMQHALDKLREMVSYATDWSCRTQTILNYFGEEAEACGSCDFCSSSPLRTFA